jgi:hypothetical protein
MTGILGGLGEAAELLGGLGGDSGDKSPSILGGLWGKIKETFTGSNDAAVEEGKEVVDSSQRERAGFFSEAVKSFIVRQFPRGGQLLDLYNATLGEKAPEVHALQNEFEFLTAFALFIPNCLKSYLTDLFADNSIFQALVEYWPGLDGVDLPLVGSTGLLSMDLPVLGKGGSLRNRVLQDKDPDAVIQVLRIMHQDAITGKVSYDSIKELLGVSGLGGSTAIAGILGLLFGGAALSGGPATGETSLLDQAKEAIFGKPEGAGKKILDLVKENPQAPQTTMQKNLIALVKELEVENSATLIKGGWVENNDDCTISFIYDGGLYYMNFDDDITGTDIQVNNSQGAEVVEFTDYGGFSAKSDADDIRKGIKKNPSEKTTTPKAANDNSVGETASGRTDAS